MAVTRITVLATQPVLAEWGSAIVEGKLAKVAYECVQRKPP